MNTNQEWALQMQEQSKADRVTITFSGSNREERTNIMAAYHAGWLNEVDYDVLRGRYYQVDKHYTSQEAKNEARNNAYRLAEQRLIGYLTHQDPSRVIAMAVEKYTGVIRYDVTVLMADLKSKTILGKPAYSFSVQIPDNKYLSGVFLIDDTSAVFLFH